MKEDRIILKKLILTYGLMFLVAPLGYLIRILYAKNLSVEEYGLIYSILGLIALVSIFNDIGFSETLNYFIPRFLVDNDWVKAKVAVFYAFIMQSSTAMLVSLLMFLNADFLAKNLFHLSQAETPIKIFSVTFLLYNFGVTLGALMSGSKEFIMMKGIELVRLSLIYILSLGIISSVKSGVLNYISVVWIVAYGLSLLIFYFIFIKKYPQLLKAPLEFDKVIYRNMIKYAFYVVIGSGATIVLSKIDIAVITLLKGVKEVAYYTTAFSVSNMIPLFINPIYMIVLPLISELNYKNNNGKIKNIIELFYNLVPPFIFPLILLFLVYPKTIINALFTEEFLPSVLGVEIFTMTLIFYIIYLFNFSLIAAFGLVKQRTKIMYIAVFINLVLDLIFVYYWGYVGAVVATSMVWSYLAISTICIIRKRIQFRINILRVLKMILGGVLFLILVSSLKRLIFLPLYVKSFLVIIISLISYFTFLFLVKAIYISEIIVLLKLAVPSFLFKKGKSAIQIFNRNRKKN